MTSIFISHSKMDKPFVRRLAQDLKKHKIKVWLDEAEIKVGDSLIEKMTSGIYQMDFLGVVLSPESVKSKWVQEELNQALHIQIAKSYVKVLPILYKDCEFPGFLLDKAFADFRDDSQYDVVVEKLVSAIKSHHKSQRTKKKDETLNSSVLGGRRTHPVAPNPPVSFVGRINEIAEIKKALSQDNFEIVAIYSMGGMGKTSLAQSYSKQNRDIYSAVLWTEITQSPNVLSHLLSWARYINPYFSPPRDMRIEEVADQVRAILDESGKDEHEKKILVVFDDVWESGINAVKLLLRAAPKHAKILLTTRQERVAEELKAKKILLSELSDGEALELFNKLVSNKKVTQDHIKNLLALVKGHPLAIEVSSASLNLAEDIDDIQGIISSYKKEINKIFPFEENEINADIPLTLMSVLKSSYLALSTECKKFFSILGVLEAQVPWDRSIASAIWNISDPQKTRRILQELRSRALLVFDENSDFTYGIPCYRQHPILRFYARSLLKSGNAKRLKAAEDRYTHHITRTMKTLTTKGNAAEQIRHLFLPHILNIGNYIFSQLENEFGDLNKYSQPEPVEILETNLKKAGIKKIINTSDAFTKAFFDLGLNEIEYESFQKKGYQMGLIVSRIKNNKKQIANYLYQLGGWYWEQEWGFLALRYAQWALSVSREITDARLEGNILSLLGSTYWLLDKPSEAIPFHEKAYEISKRLKGEHFQSHNLGNIGSAYLSMKEMDKALSYFEESLRIHPNCSNKSWQATTLTNIGSIYVDKGEIDRALEILGKALALRRESKDRAGEILTLNNISNAYFEGGDLKLAIENMEESVAICRDISHWGRLARNLSNLAVFYLRAEKINLANSCVQQLLQILSKIPSEQALEIYNNFLLPLASALEDITLFYAGVQANQEMGHTEHALELSRQAYDAAKKKDNTAQQAIFLHLMGNLYKDNNNLFNAENCFQEGLSLSLEENMQQVRSEMMSSLGVVFLERNEIEKALKEFHGSLKIKRRIGDKLGESTVLHNIGLVYEKSGQHEKALKNLQRALLVKQELGDLTNEITITLNIGGIYAILGMINDSLEMYERALYLSTKIDNNTIQARVLTGLAGEYQKIGANKKAENCLQSVLNIQRILNNKKEEALALAKLASFYMSIGELEISEKYFEDAILIQSNLNDLADLSTTQNELAALHRKLGDIQGALSLYQEALRAKQDLKDFRNEVIILSNIASLQGDLARADEAIDTYKKALEISERYNYLEEKISSCQGIASVYLFKRDLQQSCLWYEKSLELSIQTGRFDEQVTTLLWLSEVHLKMENKQQAMDTAQKALEISTHVGDKSGKAHALKQIASILRSEDPQKSLSLYQIALLIANEIQDAGLSSTIINDMSLTYFANHQSDQALKLLNDALTEKKHLNDFFNQSIILGNMANIYLNIGEIEKSILMLDESLVIKQKMNDKLGEADVLSDIAVAYEKLKDFNAAIEYRRKALSIQKELHNRLYESNSLNNLALLFLQVEKIDEAISLFEQALCIKKEIGHQETEVIVLGNLSSLYESTNQREKACAYLLEELDVIQKLGDVEREKEILDDLARLGCH